MRKTADKSSDCIISHKSSDKRSSCHTLANGSKATFLWLCLLLMFGRSSSLEELTDKESVISESYEELKFDHEVSELDAEQALRKLNASKTRFSSNLRSLCDSVRLQLLAQLCAGMGL